MFSTIPTFSTNPYNPFPRLVHELGIIWDDARATKFETMKTRHLCSKAHSPRSRCRSQVSTNHLASGRCPRSAALCRAVCPDDCGRERESPQFVGMVERLKKLGSDWWKILHCWMIYPFTDGVPVSGDSILHCHLQLPGGQRLLEKVEEWNTIERSGFVWKWVLSIFIHQIKMMIWEHALCSNKPK